MQYIGGIIVVIIGLAIAKAQVLTFGWIQEWIGIVIFAFGISLLCLRFDKKSQMSTRYGKQEKDARLNAVWRINHAETFNPQTRIQNQAKYLRKPR